MDPVGLARIASLAVGIGLTVPALAAGPDSPTVTLWADRDDDDANGVPDADDTRPGAASFVDLVDVERVDKRLVGVAFDASAGGDHVRLVSAAGPVAWGRIPPRSAWLEGLSAGKAQLVARTARGPVRVTVEVRGLALRDGAGAGVDMARSQVSLARTAPTRVERGAGAPFDDPDAVRAVVAVPGGASAPDLGVESLTALGVRLDALPHVGLEPLTCPGGEGDMQCWASPPLRVVVDDVDRNHPLGAGRSIKGEVGGAIVFRSDGRKAQMVRILGPRSSPVGRIGRLRAVVRPFVVRSTPGGPPAIGGTDAGAIAALRSELTVASAVWGQCGVTLGDSRSLDVRVVDPPPSHLVAIGDGLGLAATAGQIRLRADGKPLTVSTTYGETPDAVAADVARVAERAGLAAIVSPNARTAPALWPSVDVSLRRHDGMLAAAETIPGVPLSTDPSLAVRIGSVELADGLAHFTDMDATAGTIEERTLVKAFDDGDPTTIEVIVVPLFSGGGRIGESFIGSDLSSVRNVVLLDRAGIRARQSSLTLAHELGHVLLDLPGHPDDYGNDTPTSLMDSDAADPSPFGPRRLSVDECARVVTQAGPKARTPLLADWPIAPIPAR
jgi:hypothetical protein